MLTDQSRGPFKVETTFHEAEAKAWPWDNSHWSWDLIGADGKCCDTGSGYTTEAEARRAAWEVARNEVA
jgi:hypothetical protein